MRSDGGAKLTVSVPQDATVFVNGRRTTSTGSHRVYASLGLTYGYAYGYVIRVQVLRDGKIVEQSQKVVLRPDENKNLAFAFSDKNGVAGVNPANSASIAAFPPGR